MLGKLAQWLLAKVFKKQGKEMYPPPKSPTGSNQDAWQRLSNGRTIGKTANIPIQSIVAPVAFVGRGSSFNLFQIQGKDDDALQLSVNLLPSLIIPAAQFPGGVVPLDGTAQDASGGRYNNDMYLHPVPATGYIYGLQAVALLEWGIGGVQARAEFDFLNGAHANICASWVRISAFIDESLDDVLTGGGVWSLGAFIGPGYPRNPNAQRTFNVGALGLTFPGSGYGLTTNPSTNPAAIAGFPVPFYAKSAWLVGSSFQSQFGTFDVNLTFYRDSNLIIPVGTFRLSETNPGPVPIPNGSFYWTLQNMGVGNQDTVSMQVIFDLSI